MTETLDLILDDKIDKALDWAVRRDFNGIDPYDALNSPVARALALGTRIGRIAWTQLLRRSPIDLRPILGIKPSANPKALGLFLEGCVKLGRLDLAQTLVERLDALRSPNASGAAWGYNFPWQNRFQLLPRYTPTIVNTAFIGHALLDYYEVSQSERALELATSTVDFILRDLRRKQDANGSFCFSYTPLDENFVHNANLLGASLLARLAQEHGATRALEPAIAALRYSMSRQREDGSWYYAERQEQRWIDSFHTGFNLESLRRILRLGLTPEYQSCYRAGVDYYATRFFLPDGTSNYYADRLYLVDIHAPAEAIYFFSGEGPERAELVERILARTLRDMYDERSGVFYFRKTKRITIKIPYMRWSQAWAFRALTEYATKGRENGRI